MTDIAIAMGDVAAASQNPHRVLIFSHDPCLQRSVQSDRVAIAHLLRAVGNANGHQDSRCVLQIGHQPVILLEVIPSNGKVVSEEW